MKKFISIGLLIVLILTACQTKATPAPATASNPPTSAPPTVTRPPSADEPTATDVPASTGGNVSSSAGPSNCTASASFVSDVTVQDNEKFEPGETFRKIWRVKNTGTCPWTSGYTLVFIKGDQMDAPAVTALSDTAPGAMLDIDVNMIAPSVESSYRADFEIHTPDGAVLPIDQSTLLWVTIKVSGDTGEGHGGGGSDDSTASAGPGFATVTCAYTINQANVDAVLAAINAYRAQYGLPPYTVNARLTQAAQAHSADMACNKLFYHNGSNGSTASSRVAASGYLASAVTENVYGSYPPLTGAEVISWWANDLADPRHNENLLSAKYVDIGIGYSFYNNFGYYVIDFAVP